MYDYFRLFASELAFSCYVTDIDIKA